MEKLNELKEEILEKVKEYHNMKFGDKKDFI
jgi:CDP-6-deoxy-D-xylo-4-hexulose-3-dehydrase